MALKKKFLDSMDMPASRAAKKAPPFAKPKASAADDEDEESAAPSEEDLEADLFGDGEEADAEAGPGADLSDDELLAEAKRRGLKVSAPEPGEDEADDDESESSEDDYEDDDLDLE